MSEYKIALFGSGGVGKSSLTGQFVSHMWTERYDPTIEDAFRKEVTVDGRECVLEMYNPPFRPLDALTRSLDTAGVEQFIAMRDHQMRDRQGFILVYDITNPASVDDLNDLYTQILRNKLTVPSTPPANPSVSPVIPLVLVGNKLDLAMERKVSHQRGKELSRQWKCPHYETSAKTRTNVDEIFYDLVRQIIAINEEAVKVQKGSGGMNVMLKQKEGGVDGEGEEGAGCSSCCVS